VFRLELVSRLLLAATHLAAASVLILGAGGAARAAIIISNGLDCSNPGNVIDHDTGDAVWVYDAPAGGPTEVCFVDGGSLGEGGDLEAYDSSSITMSGGTVGDSVSAYDFSTITISGGVAMSSLYALDSSTMIFFGGSFMVDGVPVPFGELAALTGVLTGTLASGDPIDNVFFQGGYDSGFGGAQATGTMILVPEPGTGLLVMAGLLGLAGWRRSEGLARRLQPRRLYQ
jgi:hypothetical protein